MNFWDLQRTIFGMMVRTILTLVTLYTFGNATDEIFVLRIITIIMVIWIFLPIFDKIRWWMKK